MLHTASFRSMNTDVAAWLWCDDFSAARRGLRQVERLFHEAHARFTRFDPASELSALNASCGRPFAASPDLFEVVEAALRYCELSHGLFNPAILDALEAAGYDRTFDLVRQRNRDRPATCRSNAKSQTERRNPLLGIPRIVVDAERRTITLPDHTRLDLGGIVKGWTAQRAAQCLARYGACLVDAGGDMATLGAPSNGSGWRVGVADPFQPTRDIATLRLCDAAVATSGIGRRRWSRHGVAQHHLIDPRTGQPAAGDLFSVTLVAPTAVEAEVYAKTVFVLGSREGLRFVDERPPLAALLVTRAGNTIPSSRLGRYLDVRFVFTPAEISAA